MLFFLLGCAPLIEAPKSFDDLTSYLYEHMEHGGEELEAGVVNLDAWLEGPVRLENLESGYVVRNLRSKAIRTVVKDYDPENEMVGVALATDMPHPVDAVAHDMFWVESLEDKPNRRYIDDYECFLSHECDRFRYVEDVHIDFPLNISVDSSVKREARWVEHEFGEALIVRRWMVAPAVLNVDWLQVEQELGLLIVVPTEKGLRRIEATWILVKLGNLPVPQSLLERMGLDQVREGQENLRDRLDRDAEE